jgi:hypothetical protein
MDALCGRVAKSVLAGRNTGFSPERLKRIRDQTGPRKACGVYFRQPRLIGARGCVVPQVWREDRGRVPSSGKTRLTECVLEQSSLEFASHAVRYVQVFSTTSVACSSLYGCSTFMASFRPWAKTKVVLALGREDRPHEGRRNGALVGEGAFEDS